MRRAFSFCILLLCLRLHAESLGKPFMRMVDAKPLLGLVEWVVNRDPARAINMVVVSEAYMASQMFQFPLDASRLKPVFEGMEPIKSHAEDFNWYLLCVPSVESGSTKPGQPQKDTAFRSYYGDNGTRRLIGWSLDSPHRIAELIDGRLPRYSAILLVNDAEYGGSGSSLLQVSSVHSASGKIALHEWGHAFAGLRDEYKITAPLFPGPNVALNATNLPWSDLGPNKVAIGDGRYRWGNNCLMLSLSSGSFCPPCFRAIEAAILNRTTP